MNLTRPLAALAAAGLLVDLALRVLGVALGGVVGVAAGGGAGREGQGGEQEREAAARGEHVNCLPPAAARHPRDLRARPYPSSPATLRGLAR